MDSQPMEIPRTTPLIAVVILNWNGAHLLREYLPQVVATTDSRISRIIVADNGSTDDSLNYVRQTFPERVEVMALGSNYGFAEGYNRAIAALDNSYRYAVLLNSDAATSKGWDSTMLKYMEEHPEVGACQPKILSYRQPDTFEYAGAAGGYIDRNGYPYCRGRIFATCEKDRGQYDNEAYIFWASGACLMIRRELYTEAGGLDPTFFAHMEEIDLCWRLQLAGYLCAAVPGAKVYHLGGGSLPAENPRKTYLNFRNNLLMLHKNLPKDVRRGILLRRRLLDTVAWARYILTLDFANAVAIWRAHRDFAAMRKNYDTNPARNLLGSAPGSDIDILSSYYLRRKHTFDTLD